MIRVAQLPAPVRAAIIANVMFLAFCLFELGDGLFRQGGRVFYWTTVLFFPALILLIGQLRAQRWAWWMTRVVSGLFVAWFAVFLALTPFVPLRGNGGPIPWWGRIYAAAVTLVFGGVAFYVFRLLGRPEARRFYGLRPKA